MVSSDGVSRQLGVDVSARPDSSAHYQLRAKSKAGVKRRPHSDMIPCASPPNRAHFVLRKARLLGRGPGARAPVRVRFPWLSFWLFWRRPGFFRVFHNVLSSLRQLTLPFASRSYHGCHPHVIQTHMNERGISGVSNDNRNYCRSLLIVRAGSPTHHHRSWM